MKWFELWETCKTVLSIKLGNNEACVIMFYYSNKSMCCPDRDLIFNSLQGEPVNKQHLHYRGFDIFTEMIKKFRCENYLVFFLFINVLFYSLIMQRWPYLTISCCILNNILKCSCLGCYSENLTLFMQQKVQQDIAVTIFKACFLFFSSFLSFFFFFCSQHVFCFTTPVVAYMPWICWQGNWTVISYTKAHKPKSHK